MRNIFYKMFLSYSEEGVEILTTKFVSIHESECFYYCIDEFFLDRYNFPEDNPKETSLQKAKRLCIKVKKIDKRGSRIAFNTKEKAFSHLMFLKTRQIQHLSRELQILRAFKLSVDGKTYDDLEKKNDSWNGGEYAVVDGARDAINEHYRFDI